ncbi:glucose-6-phosphate isomerase [Wenzhouxiangella marina]|uniref:glucose-6-phosphate isomerase n=1 Tax=Wenzhouxiangella marina TaxID=1579979 RepID=UPI0014706CFF|nr:glucose-6-phosphate isomerase [Wenzhouxiangella marina]MBB6087833.1 glucose-6-phosphate isomerase [Wenzhouxiangella marina]
MFDWSRVPIDDAALDAIISELREVGLESATQRLFAGEQVNPSEGQSATHTRLRQQPRPESTRRFLEQAERLHSGQAGLSDLIHIGIGGSDLGPRLIDRALAEGDSALRVHWLSSLDSRSCRALLSELDPASTGMVLASKSFTTEETLVQAAVVRDWLGPAWAERSWAATARPDRAREFGLPDEAILGFPDSVGGRFSLWSSIGVSAAASIGRERFESLLDGAAEADQAFLAAQGDLGGQRELATMLAVLLHHFRRGLDRPTLGVISYEPRLSLLGDFLQQLIMESLGKGADLDDRPLDRPTAPLVFGGIGTGAQHSIFQALHQGADDHSLILVGTVRDRQADPAWQRTQLAHLLAQAQALAFGRQEGRACQRMPGNRPVALLLGRELDARSLGYLLASFEHAVFALSVLWQINPFDQWGVEEGKRLAGNFSRRLASDEPDLEDFPDAGFF